MENISTEKVVTAVVVHCDWLAELNPGVAAHARGVDAVVIVFDSKRAAVLCRYFGQACRVCTYSKFLE